MNYVDGEYNKYNISKGGVIGRGSSMYGSGCMCIQNFCEQRKCH
jgi:hypothetical protein